MPSQAKALQAISRLMYNLGTLPTPCRLNTVMIFKGIS